MHFTRLKLIFPSLFSENKFVFPSNGHFPVSLHYLIIKIKYKKKKTAPVLNISTFSEYSDIFFAFNNSGARYPGVPHFKYKGF